MERRKFDKSSKRRSLEICLYFIPIPVFLTALCIGAYKLRITEVIDIILYKICGYTLFDSRLKALAVKALFDIRLPRVILSMLVGAALSVSGASFQSIMKNPLVEPYTLGVSSGAAFGAAFSMAFSLMPVQISAFAFAMLSIALCYGIARQKEQLSVISLILAGIVISSIFTAALSAIQLFVDPLKLQGLIFWTMGAFYTTTWSKVFSSVGFMAAGFALIFIFRWKLNILSLGDQEAKILGVNPALYKGIIIFAATLLASSSVAVTGIISLVGLMIPHVCRMLFGPDNKKLVPLSMALGASYLTVVDTFARNLFTFEIPVGIFTTFLGAPFFIILLRKVRSAGWN
ncbi:MAG: iron ABC transporter permease [Clostridiales bacterium]|nr:iron ABC transporter permease [Clostridiales bacterium]